MSFSDFKKRKLRKPKEIPSVAQAKSIPINNNVIKEKQSYQTRLLADNAIALNNILIWCPFFCGAWLVSGITFHKPITLSLIFFFIMGVFLFTNSENQKKKNSLKKINEFPLLFGGLLLYVLFVYYQDQRIIIALSIFIVTLSLLIQSLLSEDQTISFWKIILKGIQPIIQTSGFVLLGIFSQLDNEIQKSELAYLLLGLMAGSSLAARSFLIDSPKLNDLGFKHEKTVRQNEKEILRPAGISRLIIGTLLIGPAIPSLLLPFSIIPHSLFAVSLSFFFLPKLAEKIQGQVGALEDRVVQVTIYAAIVQALVFVGAFWG